MSGPSLLELGKEWLPIIYPSETDNVDCTFYNASVSPDVVGMKWDSKGEMTNPGKKGFKWGASFNIRHGKTTVHLHSDEQDKYLKRFRKKLRNLSKGIQAFLVESKKRVETPGEGKIELRREWLNDLTEETPYTGHFLYKIDPNGGGLFSVGDCHRAIVLHMELYCFEGSTKDNYFVKVLKNYWAYLEAIDSQLKRAIESINTLNTRLRNGELAAKLPDDSDKVIYISPSR